MNCIYIGTFIKQRRKELKLTQEQVCSGICDPVTLSRIENGKQAPSKSVISALLQRLGMPEARYYVLESKTILDKGIMPSEKVLDFPVDCNTLTGSVNL